MIFSSYFRPDQKFDTLFHTYFSCNTVDVTISGGLLLMVLSPNVASPRKYTQFKTLGHKPYPISDQNSQNQYPILDQND